VGGPQSLSVNYGNKMLLALILNPNLTPCREGRSGVPISTELMDIYFVGFQRQWNVQLDVQVGTVNLLQTSLFQFDRIQIQGQPVAWNLTLSSTTTK
jgi:hypothetical protein